MTTLHLRRPAVVNLRPSPRAQRSAHRLSTALLALALAVLVAVGIAPRLLHYRTMVMLTGSMRPHYPTGSILIDTGQPVSRLRVGQVITYHIPVGDHRVISHRVIGIQRTSSGTVVETKGDANDGPDPWRAHIDANKVWVVRAAIPHAGDLVLFLRRPLVLRLIEYVLPGVLLVWLLVGVYTSETRRRS